jgi:transposase
MKKTQYFIGIDLHKIVIQVWVLNTAGDRVGEFRQRLAEVPRVAASKNQLPRVGAQTSLTLDAELVDLTHFGSAKQLCAYAELVPRVTDSTEPRRE